MDHIRSFEDLTAAREEALKQNTADARQYPIQIRISMGSCGIAAGANETLEAMQLFIEENHLEGIRIKGIGCIGLCALEPIVQVVELGGRQVTYGKVDPAIVRRIFTEHIEKHLIVQEQVVDPI